MRLLDFIFEKSKQTERQEQEKSKPERQINIADNASTIDNLSSEKVMNRKLQNNSIMQDFRVSFYAFEDIKVISIGESWQIAPYDAFWYFQVPDATILPSLTNTTKIKKFLPGLGFDDENSAKKRLEGFMLKVEAQMGVTYVIRNQNIPMGMIFVNSPLYNRQTINLSIWTVDFFISEMAEHKGVMFQSLIRVLNVMKVSMGAKNVYALVDENNIDCIKLIGNGLFAKVDNAGFANNTMGGKKPLVYMIDLTKTKFGK